MNGSMPGLVHSQTSLVVHANAWFLHGTSQGLIQWGFSGFNTKLFPRFQIQGPLDFGCSPMHFPMVSRFLASRNTRFFLGARPPGKCFQHNLLRRYTWYFTRVLLRYNVRALRSMHRSTRTQTFVDLHGRYSGDLHRRYIVDINTSVLLVLLSSLGRGDRSHCTTNNTEMGAIAGCGTRKMGGGAQASGQLRTPP